MSYPFDCISDFMFFETGIKESDVILIPGASHPQLIERAAMLFHQGIAPYILPSGGATPHVETTEWEFLRNLGVSLGGPTEAILKEDTATNTFENARLSLKVLLQRGVQPKNVVLVCKNYHARRALLTYQFISKTPYGLAHNLHGLDGMIQYFTVRKRIEEKVLSQGIMMNNEYLIKTTIGAKFVNKYEAIFQHDLIPIVKILQYHFADEPTGTIVKKGVTAAAVAPFYIWT